VKKWYNKIMDIIDQMLLHIYDSIDAGTTFGAKKKLGIYKYFDHWNKELKREEIDKAFNELSRSKLIQKKKDYNGSIIVSLTEKGRLRALNYSFKKFSNRKEKWDGKWRMVAFDVPNECRKGRDALRYRMKIGGFYMLQDSLFIYPYDCEKEIKAIIDLFKLQKYVRLGILEDIDNNEELKKKFKLS